MIQNHYCCHCHRTTKFLVSDRTYTCTGCGVVIESKERSAERSLVGNPMRSFKTSAA